MRLSIVTISYNQGRYLRECLDSVVSQIEPGDEYIVCDPGSVDGSREILGNYLRRNEISCLQLEPDGGPPDGLNRGFMRAHGDIYAYLNSDDFYLPGSLMRVRRYFSDHPGVDVLVSPVRIARDNGRLAARPRAPDPISAERIAGGCCFYVQQGTFIRATAFKRTAGFNVGNLTCWDYELIADLAASGATIRRYLRPLAAFRIHSDSITGRSDNGQRYAADLARIRGRLSAALGPKPAQSVWIRISQRVRRLGLSRRLIESVLSII